MWGNIAIAFLLAFIVSFMATPYTIKIAEKIHSYSDTKCYHHPANSADHPTDKDKKQHKRHHKKRRLK